MKQLAKSFTEPWVTLPEEASHSHAESVRQALLAAGFQIATQQKKEEEAKKQRCNMTGRKDRKTQ